MAGLNYLEKRSVEWYKFLGRRDDDEDEKTKTEDDDKTKTKVSSTSTTSITSQTTQITTSVTPQATQLITSVQVITTTSAVGGSIVPITQTTLITSTSASLLPISTTTAIATATETTKKANPLATTPLAAIATNSSTSKAGIEDAEKGLSGSSIALIVLATAGGTMLLMSLIFILFRRSSAKKRALTDTSQTPPSAPRSTGGTSMFPSIFPPRTSQYLGGTTADSFPAHPMMMPAAETTEGRRWSYRTDNTDMRAERLNRVRNDLLEPRDLAMRDELAVGAGVKAMTSGVTGVRGSGVPGGLRREVGIEVLNEKMGTESRSTIVEGEEGRVVIEAGGTWKGGKVLARRGSNEMSVVSEGDGGKWRRPLEWLKRNEGQGAGGEGGVSGKKSDRSSMSTFWR